MTQYTNYMHIYRYTCTTTSCITAGFWYGDSSYRGVIRWQLLMKNESGQQLNVAFMINNCTGFLTGLYQL